MENKWKIARDILVRAGKTFAQAFASYLSIDVFFGITDLNTLKKVAVSLLVGALAAGFSALWNTFIEWLTIRIGDIELFEDGDEDGNNPE